MTSLSSISPTLVQQSPAPPYSWPSGSSFRALLSARATHFQSDSSLATVEAIKLHWHHSFPTSVLCISSELGRCLLQIPYLREVSQEKEMNACEANRNNVRIDSSFRKNHKWSELSTNEATPRHDTHLPTLETRSSPYHYAPGASTFHLYRCPIVPKNLLPVIQHPIQLIFTPFNSLICIARTYKGFDGEFLHCFSSSVTNAEGEISSQLLRDARRVLAFLK